MPIGALVEGETVAARRFELNDCEMVEGCETSGECYTEWKFESSFRVNLNVVNFCKGDNTMQDLIPGPFTAVS